MNTNKISLKASILYIGLALVVAVGLVWVVLSLLRNQEAAPTGAQLQVVAGENFWGDIASQIGGKYVKVASIISDPEADPHLYESNAQNAAAVGSASLVVTNGLGYDDFMDKLVAASPKDSRVVVNAAQLTGAQDGANPHLWYDASRVKQVAAAIEEALAQQDPAHREEFESHLKTFNASLQSVIDEVNEIKVAQAGAGVVTTEPVADYLLQNAGLVVKTPEKFSEAIEAGNEPAPADIAALEELIAGRRVKVLLYNSQATSPVTERIQNTARTAGVPVVGVTETLPKGKNFQTWQLDQVKALRQALSGS